MKLSLKTINLLTQTFVCVFIVGQLSCSSTPKKPTKAPTSGVPEKLEYLPRPVLEASREEVLKRSYVEVKVAKTSPHTCALRTSGILDCWGKDGEIASVYASDSNGELGLASLKDYKIGAFEITNTFGCALTEQKRTICWSSGHQHMSFLGNITQKDKTLKNPFLRTLLSKTFDEIFLGEQFFCGTKNAVQCWGLKTFISTDRNPRGSTYNPETEVRFGELDASSLERLSRLTFEEQKFCGLNELKKESCFVYGPMRKGSGLGSKKTSTTKTANWNQPTVYTKNYGFYPPIPKSKRLSSKAAIHKCAVSTRGQLNCEGTNRFDLPILKTEHIKKLQFHPRRICVVDQFGSLKCHTRNATNVPSFPPGVYKDVVLHYPGGCALMDDDKLICVDNFEGKNGPTKPHVYSSQKDLDMVNLYNGFACGIERGGLKSHCYGKGAPNDVIPKDDTYLRNKQTKRIDFQYSYHAVCALRTDQTLSCTTDQYGQKESWSGLKTKFSKVFLGQVAGCGLTTDDKISCFGRTSELGKEKLSGTFHDISSARAYKQIFCALSSEGSVECIGNGKASVSRVKIDAPKASTLSGLCLVFPEEKESLHRSCWGADYQVNKKETITTSRYKSETHPQNEVTCWINRTGNLFCQRKRETPYEPFPEENFKSVETSRNEICGFRVDGTLRCGGTIMPLNMDDESSSVGLGVNE